MTEHNLPPNIDKIFDDNSTPEAVFSALLPTLGEMLQCDRIFLYLRDPHTRLGKVPYYWLRTPEYPKIFDSTWNKEPESLPKEDPLFAAALRTDPSIFVEDVETADPSVVNKSFEQREFGHRALVHAHLCQDGHMWGILQPCVFGQPRVWTEEEHSIITALTEKLAPLAVAYVQSNKPDGA
jgi:GAF domain-containing protein